MNPEHIEKIIANHDGKQGALISILEDIQDLYHYLPEEALRTVARETGQRLVDVYGVATFYKAFSLKPRGKHLISVCMGTACHVRSAPGIVDEFTRQLGLRPGETTEDGEFTLETVNCLGTCALGPIVVADGKYFSNVKRSDVKKILQKAGSGFPSARDGKGEMLFPVDVLCPLCGLPVTDAHHHIENNPSLLLNMSFNGKKGWIRLSSLYGSTCQESEHDIPQDSLITFSCPHCRGRLAEKLNCIECGAPMVPLEFQGGGTLLVCVRSGCMSRRITLNGSGLPVETSNRTTSIIPG